MIIAIADDITGAAEIGGIAWRQGLKVLLSDSVHPTDADLLVVYSNTRSMPEEEARAIMGQLALKARGLNPEWLYKKTDSVLRGHVATELEAMLTAMGEEQVLFLPANPATGRIIRNEKYYIGDRLLSQTEFATDPEFPAHTALVSDLLRSSSVSVRKYGAAWGQARIIVGEAETAGDLEQWAESSADRTFLAGGGAFFGALLRKRVAAKPPAKKDDKPGQPMLLVSGTKYGPSHERLLADPHVFLLPLKSGELNQLVARLGKTGEARMGFSDAISGTGAELRKQMAEATAAVFSQVAIQELFIEGGSTAFSIVQELGLTNFAPVFEWAPGVVRLRVQERPGLHLTIKPGSYPWPPTLPF